MNNSVKKQIEEFRARAEEFSRGEINAAEFKHFSGKFGSYAQRGGEKGMVRLRIAGGQLSKEKLKSVIEICDKYNINKLHMTTCQTIQLHDLPITSLADVVTDAVKKGFYTLGGGGDFPRNVMVSPLSGVEEGEYFDVTPYALAAADYLITQIDAVKMPRKLKVAFSNSPANVPHATFRDLGFVAREGGTFDVYCAGGMGNNPRMGVKVDEGVSPAKALYYIKAMISFFCGNGNYEVRSKARTRYMQETLGDAFTETYRAHLEKALSEGGLDIDVKAEEITKTGEETDFSARSVIKQKQTGLYAVKYHPVGGVMTAADVKNLYDAVSGIDGAEMRLSPEEFMYIINCTASEAKTLLEKLTNNAKSDIEESVACIGASVCQQGLRDSQELLREILAEVKKHNFAPDALPQIHISGCLSSCGTHQIGSIGFHGRVKMVDKKPQPAFTVTLGGSDRQGSERFGAEIGTVLSEEIPRLIVEIGEAVTKSGLSYSDYANENPSALTELIQKYC